MKSDLKLSENKDPFGVQDSPGIRFSIVSGLSGWKALTKIPDPASRGNALRQPIWYSLIFR
jgi:hypothetical protein